MKELITALNKARLEIEPIHKDGKSHHGRYAKLDSIVEYCTPILAKNNLIIVQTFKDHSIITQLWHESGQHIESSLQMIIEKQTSQGLGIAITYSRRYSYCAILSLALDDDTDGNHKPDNKSKPAKQEKTNPQPRTGTPLEKLAYDLSTCRTQEHCDIIQEGWNEYIRSNKGDGAKLENEQGNQFISDRRGGVN